MQLAFFQFYSLFTKYDIADYLVIPTGKFHLISDVEGQLHEKKEKSSF